jgi:hypothetical protein
MLWNRAGKVDWQEKLDLNCLGIWFVDSPESNEPVECLTRDFEWRRALNALSLIFKLQGLLGAIRRQTFCNCLRGSQFSS